METRMNPVLRIEEALDRRVLGRRLDALQKLLRKKGLGALLFERRWLRSDRWMNDLSTFGADNEGWYLVPAQGIAWATNGFALEEGHALGREGLALYAPDGSLVNWLTDCDLLDMLGDRLIEDGMEPDHDLTQVRAGSVKLISALGAEDLRALLGEAPRLGVVCPDEIRASLYDWLQAVIPGLEMVDITTDVLALRAVRESSEQEILRTVARQHDRALCQTANALKEGMTERECADLLRYQAYHFGSAGFNWKQAAQAQIFFTDDKDTVERNLRFPGRRLQRGDRISLGLRAMGSSGFYGGLCRSFVLGEAAAGVRERWQEAVALTDRAAAMLRPGVTLREVRLEIERELAARGFGKPKGTYICSVCYMAQEPPETNGVGEEISLSDGMVFYVAPPVYLDGHMPYVCGDFYALEDGAARRLTNAPRGLIEL